MSLDAATSRTRFDGVDDRHALPVIAARALRSQPKHG